MKDLQARLGGCEEASPASTTFYIPCNKQAERMIESRDKTTYRMCAACADHNAKNRGAKDIGAFDGPIADEPENPRAVFGGNNPPPYDPAVIEGFRPRINAFAASMGQWLDLGVIESEEDASRLNDFLTGARKLFKEIDEARVAAKKPHDENGKAVQAAFTPLLDLLTKTAEKGKPLLTDWAQKQQAILRARQEAERAEAARMAEVARVAQMQAAARNDVVGEVEAEALAKVAEKAQKAADKPVNTKVASATGGGRTMAMRSIANVKLTNINLLFMEFRDAPEVAELLVTLARRRVRAATWVKGAAIPGGEVYYEESMA